MIDMKDKPKLTLPVQREQIQFGDRLYAIVAEELKRADYNKSIAFEAVMKRITDDQQFYQELALNQIRRLCRRRIKKFNSARTLMGVK